MLRTDFPLVTGNEKKKLKRVELKLLPIESMWVLGGLGIMCPLCTCLWSAPSNAEFEDLSLQNKQSTTRSITHTTGQAVLPESRWKLIGRIGGAPAFCCVADRHLVLCLHFKQLPPPELAPILTLNSPVEKREVNWCLPSSQVHPSSPLPPPPPLSTAIRCPLKQLSRWGGFTWWGSNALVQFHFGVKLGWTCQSWYYQTN